MKILINSLRFEAIVGILYFERTSPQKLEVDIEIEYNGDIIDYSIVRKNVIQTMQVEKFEYLEDAVIFFKKSLKNLFPQMTSLEIYIKKPAIFNDCIVGVKEKFIF